MKISYRLVGVIVTAIWIASLAAYFVANFTAFTTLTPNEVGDFLAGALGPVAVLWLILGFWQQGDELRASVEALRLQSDELRNSVEQQKALVEVTRSQAAAEIEALHEERRRRLEMTMPRFHLHSGGGSISGGHYASGLTLYNLGADCTNVTIFDSETKTVIKSLATFKNGEEKLFQLQHKDKDHLDFQLEINFSTSEGLAGKKVFRLVRPNPKQVGFTIDSVNDSPTT